MLLGIHAGAVAASLTPPLFCSNPVDFAHRTAAVQFTGEFPAVAQRSGSGAA